MGAAVTKYHKDDSGYYKFDEVCPAINVAGKGLVCSAPANSSDDEVKKMGDRKYYLVSDHVGNPAMGSMLPYPVTEPGFFLDTMDHTTKKDLTADPEALKKALYFMTTQRDPRGADAESAAKLQVPGTWCAHMKPCPAGVPCCPEVQPAVPVLSGASGSPAVTTTTTKSSSLKTQITRAVIALIVLFAIYYAWSRYFSKRPTGAVRTARTNYRPAGSEVY